MGGLSRSLAKCALCKIARILNQPVLLKNKGLSRADKRAELAPPIRTAEEVSRISESPAAIRRRDQGPENRPAKLADSDRGKYSVLRNSGNVRDEETIVRPRTQLR